MNPIDLFEVVKMLEKDLAKFYEKLRNVTQFQEFVEVFDTMAKHSNAHSQAISSRYQSIKLPELNLESIYKLHNKIKKSLFDQVTSEQNRQKALILLANSEEIIGQLYSSIAENYVKTASAYQTAADQLKQLAKDELRHRDFILKKISQK